MASDTHDAVLAEMRELADGARPTIAEIRPRSAILADAIKAVSNLLDRVDDWRDRLAAAHAAEVAERDARIERLFAANEQVMARAEAAERDARDKQARIDALMLEYCPEEMTPEQVAEWRGAIATTEQADED